MPSADPTLDFVYSAGTMTLTNGSAIVTGQLTGWDAALLPYDFIFANDGLGGMSVVAEVLSSTQLRLVKPWPRATMTAVPYFAVRWIRHTDPRIYGVRVTNYLEGLRTVPADLADQLAAKAGLVSPAFMGTPTVPTPSAGSSSLRIANMAAIAAAVDGTMAAIAAAVGGTVRSDGSSTITADIPWGDHRITGLADANASQDALNRQSADARFLLRSSISMIPPAYSVAVTDQGKTLIGTGTWTLSLAAATTLGPKFSFKLKNAGTGIITVDPNGSELVDGVATITVPPGLSAEITCDGSAFYTTFLPPVTPTGLLSAQGYARFGNGLILQWGSIGGGTGSADRNFPIAFPTAVVSVTATPIGTQPGATTGVISNLSNTGFTLFRRYNQGSTSNDAGENFYYKAIGF